MRPIAARSVRDIPGGRSLRRGYALLEALGAVGYCPRLIARKALEIAAATDDLIIHADTGPHAGRLPSRWWTAGGSGTARGGCPRSVRPEGQPRDSGAGATTPGGVPRRRRDRSCPRVDRTDVDSPGRRAERPSLPTCRLSDTRPVVELIRGCFGEAYRAPTAGPLGRTRKEGSR